jgi:hypothetical protein
VSGSSSVGGFAGYNAATITNSFWDTQTSGQATSAAGTGKTTSEMKDPATFTDENTSGLTTAWDFETNPNDDAANNDYWDMDQSGSTNSGYPFLSWQNGTDTSLPVELSSFNAVLVRNSAILLKWVTESENENLGFILEQRTAGTDNWTVIASYMTHPDLTGHGSVTLRTEYEFTDEAVNPGMTYEYRLADISYSGIKTYLGNCVVKSLSNNLPSSFKLFQAYPNPFNPSSTISYDLPEASDVILIIYDIKGRSIRTLTDTYQPAGTFNLQWNGTTNDGSQVGTGVYFTRIQVGKHSGVIKIVYLR